MSLPMPTVRITKDCMEAYMTVPPTESDSSEKYTVEFLAEALRLNHVKMGIQQEKLQRIIDMEVYNREVLVAQGEEAKDGQSGYFEFLFETNLSQKPIVQEDGTVDYKNIKMIELVEPGQTIAIYHPATAGINGYNLAAEFRVARNGAELPPLKGTGFECLEDGVTYRAVVGGKITMLNNRVNIFQVHEVFGDVDLSTGNIDFNGDVIIHGNVLEGMSVKATGTVTVDKVVESAYIEGKKGVILRGGVLGKNGAQIRSKGNIAAQFFEYANVNTDGDIEADSFLDSHVYAGGKIVLSGRKGCIVGGKTHAVCGIEAREIGNMAGANTEVSVGVPESVYQEIAVLDREMKDDAKQLKRIEEGLSQFEKIMSQKGLPFWDDPRRMALVKEKLRLAAHIAGCNQKLDDLQQNIDASNAACIQVLKGVYVGVNICVDEQSVQVKDQQQAVEFKKHMGIIGMFNIGYTVK